MELANCGNIATAGGPVEALWPRGDVPLDVGPGARVPSSPRGGCVRGPSVSTATRTSTLHVAVSLAAERRALPRALASATSPLPLGIRLTPAPARGEPGGSSSVPGCCLPLRVGPHCAPGYCGEACWSTRSSVQPFSMPVVGQAKNPRRLVPHHDASEVRSCTYPCATVLGGIRWWVPRDRLTPAS